MQASVIIASYDRPALLDRVLCALRYQRGVTFDVVVVSNTKPSETFLRDISFAEISEANLAKARNLGAMMAGSSILAFCDDDAVPEPDWLARLLAGFKHKSVGLAVGFVLGRNGISLQWGARRVDVWGDETPFELSAPKVFDPDRDRPVKLQGTNFAIRKSLWKKLDGFDERFAYYLEETDFVFRANAAGVKTYLDPDALVQHGFMANATRRANRSQVSLEQIARSYACFAHTHIAPNNFADALEQFRDRQKLRLIAQMNSGLLEPGQLAPILESMELGLADLKEPALFKQKAAKAHSVEFQTFGGAKEIRFMRARKLAKLPHHPLQIVQLGLGFRPHSRSFDDSGYWLQKGGRFGRITRRRPKANHNHETNRFIASLPSFWRDSDS